MAICFPCIRREQNPLMETARFGPRPWVTPCIRRRVAGFLSFRTTLCLGHSMPQPPLRWTLCLSRSMPPAAADVSPFRSASPPRAEPPAGDGLIRASAIDHATHLPRAAGFLRLRSTLCLCRSMPQLPLRATLCLRLSMPPAAADASPFLSVYPP